MKDAQLKYKKMLLNFISKRRFKVPPIFFFCVMLLVICASDVSTAEMAVLKVGEAVTKPGETINIPITLENNSGIAGLLLKIEYDSSRLHLDGANAVTRGTALSNLTYVGIREENAMKNPFVVLWYGVSNDSGSGVILNVQFTVLSDALAGEADIIIGCEPNDAVNDSGKPIALSIQNAAVTVIRDGDSVALPNTGTENPPIDIPPVDSDKSEVIEVDSFYVPEKIKQSANENPVFTIYSNETENMLAASVPYKNDDGEMPENLIVYHLDNSGAMKPVTKSKYDEKNKIMKFFGAVGKSYIIASNKMNFSDVLEKDWFFKAVSFVTARGLFEGIGGNFFAPSDTMTRAMFITVLARLDGVDLSQYKTSPYSDTLINMWYGAAISWAEQMGIIDAGILSGCGAGIFKPNDNITREQMAVIFANYIRIKKLSLEKREMQDFSDMGQASDWAKSAIHFMRSHLIINGIGNNLYNPKGTATRAEVAQIFTNLIYAIIG